MGGQWVGHRHRCTPHHQYHREVEHAPGIAAVRAGPGCPMEIAVASFSAGWGGSIESTAHLSISPDLQSLRCTPYLQLSFSLSLHTHTHSQHSAYVHTYMQSSPEDLRLFILPQFSHLLLGRSIQLHLLIFKLLQPLLLCQVRLSKPTDTDDHKWPVHTKTADTTGKHWACTQSDHTRRTHKYTDHT